MGPRSVAGPLLKYYWYFMKMFGLLSILLFLESGVEHWRNIFFIVWLGATEDGMPHLRGKDVFFPKVRL